MHATLCIRSNTQHKDEALECNSASSTKSPLGFASMQKKEKEKRKIKYLEGSSTAGGLNPVVSSRKINIVANQFGEVF